MTLRRIFFIYEVHLINYLILVFLSLFGRIVYIKKHKILKLESDRFFRLDVNSLLLNGQSEFNSINAVSYSDFKNHVERSPSKYFAFGRIEGRLINFTDQYVFDVGRKYEIFNQYLYFGKLLERRFPKIKIIYLFPSKKFFIPIKLNKKIKIPQYLLVKLFNFADCLWSQLIILYQIYKFLLPRYNSKLLPHMKTLDLNVLWSGINPQEVNLNKNDRLARFWFLESRNLNNKGKILYILPITQPQAKKINNDLMERFFVLSSEELPSVVSRIKRLKLLMNHTYDVFSNNIFNLFRKKRIRLVSCSYFIQCFNEYYICKHLNLKTFLTSNSAHTIYNAKFASCSSLGIKTVLWQYSGVGLIPFDNSLINKNQKIIGRFAQYSFACSDVLVWSKADAKILKNRLIKNIGTTPKFNAIGPMMSGDISNLSFTYSEMQEMRSAFLKEHNLCKDAPKYWITIFDMPTHSKELVATTELPISRITEEEQDLFFGGLLKLFKQNPNIAFIMKPKRRVKKDKFILSKNHQLFINLAQSIESKHRIYLIPHNIDPYIPLGISDAVISMPFSSALQAAVSFGIPSVYYDAAGQYEHIYPDNDYLIAKNYSELQSIILEWIEKSNSRQISKILDFQKSFAEEIGVASK